MQLTVGLQNALADEIDARVNTGAGTARLVFETLADAEVAGMNLPNPAFGAAASGVITLQGVPLTDVDANGGTIDHVTVYNRDAAAEFDLTCTATGGGGNIEISSLTVGAGDEVELTSLTITVPAGT